MKYNEKYGRWFTKGGLVYRYDSKQDKLVLCELCDNHGYKQFHAYKGKTYYVHIAVHETFVGEIPEGYEIDHLNATRDDNRIDNLRILTHSENCNNPLTIKNSSESMKGNKNAFNKPTSVFGKKYFEHFGYSSHKNIIQYKKEYNWYRKYGKCRWEK